MKVLFLNAFKVQLFSIKYLREYIKKHSDYLIAALFFCVAVIWKWPYLGVRDLALDEPFTLFHSQGSIWDILRLPSSKEPNPPLFMIMVHYWKMIVGYSAEHLRILPLLFHGLTAALLYLSGKRFFGYCAGFLAVVLFLFSNYYFYFALELRSYGLFSLLTIVALYLFISASEKNRRKHFVLLALCNILLIYTHYFGWFVVLAQSLSSLLYLKNKKVLKSQFTVLIITALAFIPILTAFFDQFSHSSQGTWVEPPGEKAFRFQLHAFLNSGMVFRLLQFVLPIGFALLILLKGFRGVPKKLIVGLIWWLVPLTVMYFLSFRVPMFLDRYVLFCSVGLFFFIGGCISVLAKFKWLQTTLSAVLAYHMINSFSINENYNRRDISEAVTFVEENQSESSLMVIHPPWKNLSFSYHYDLELFKIYKNLEGELNKRRVFSEWSGNRIHELADSLNADRIIFFTNNGLDSSKEFLSGLEQNFLLEESRDFQDNIHVKIFHR